MKKIFTLCLSLLLMMGSGFTVAEAANSQEANALTMPGWTADSERVTRVYNNTRQSWEARITNNTGWSYYLTYMIPIEKLTEGHTYSFSAYVRTEGRPNVWIAMDLGGKTDFTPYVPQQNGGGVLGVGGLNLAGNNKIAFGFTAAGTCVMYLDDIVIKDETTGDTLDLPNLNFETTIQCSKIENAAYSGVNLTWTLPDTTVGNSINVYKRDLAGKSVRLNDKAISISALSARLDVVQDSSYYLDIYTCYDGIEDKTTLVTVAVIGEFDIGEVKLYSGDSPITTPQAGTLAVKIPVVNHKNEDGFKFTAIVQTLKANAVTGTVIREFDVAKGDDFSDCTVEITATAEDTGVEVYLWDGADSMNVLKDASAF